MTKYSSLFLDIDNTLLDFRKAEAVAIRKVLKDFSLPFDDQTVKLYSRINDSLWKRFEKGEIKKSEIFESRFKILLERLNLSGNVSKISNAYLQNLSEGYFTVEGAKELLEYLKNKGYKLYATTNGMALTQFKRIEKSGIKPYFDKIFVSEEVGFQKPQKEYYDYCFLNIEEKDKSKVLIIGDSQSSDILGGKNSGIDTCWFNIYKEEKIINPDYTVYTLEELKTIL